MRKIILLFFVLLLAACTGKIEKTKNQTNIQNSGDLQVHFLDVGQGDAIFIKSPNGQTMLIDGGVKGVGQQVVDYIQEQGVEKLNFVVATHPDAAHIGGLISVLNEIPIDYFIDSGKMHTSSTYEEMLQLIDKNHIQYIVPKTGGQIQLDDVLKVDILYANENASNHHEASIVLKVTYDEISFLLMGGANISIENELMQHADLKATILKAAQHGSNISSSNEFLRAVQPEITILSYGQDNPHGHPDFEVVSRLKKIGSKIYSTAESGTIVIKTNGKSYTTSAPEWTGIGATGSLAKPSIEE